MKVTKNQLRRIIKEAITTADIAGGFDIPQADYDKFVDAIDAGIGSIEAWDVGRQWEGIVGYKLTPDEEEYVIENLDANGLISYEGDDY